MARKQCVNAGRRIRNAQHNRRVLHGQAWDQYSRWPNQAHRDSLVRWRIGCVVSRKHPRRNL
eukprot:1516083-Rhodomonas_salina.2